MDISALIAGSSFGMEKVIGITVPSAIPIASSIAATDAR